MISYSYSVRSCITFAGHTDRWITRGSVLWVSWSAGRILSVSWERIDSGEATERVSVQHEAVDGGRLQWGEWSSFYIHLIGRAVVKFKSSNKIPKPVRSKKCWVLVQANKEIHVWLRRIGIRKEGRDREELSCNLMTMIDRVRQP